MAFQIGTANGIWDFYNRISDFLTSDPTLVAGSQNWTLEETKRGPAYVTSDVGANSGSVLNPFDYSNEDISVTFRNTNGMARLALMLHEPQIVQRINIGYGPYASISSWTHDNLTIEASQDGSNWTELGNFPNVQSPTPWAQGQYKDFDLSTNTTAYSWYRFVINSEGSGWRYAGIGKIRMFDETDTGIFDWQHPQHRYFRLPGISSQDNGVIALQLYSSPYSDIWNLGIYGARDRSNDVNINGSGWKYSALWNQDIPYWLVANNFRFAFGARIDTIYAAAYGGMFLPYGTPSQYPHPMLIGGDVGTQDTRWNSTSQHTSYMWERSGMMRLCLPDNTWTTFNTRHPDGQSMWPYNHALFNGIQETPISSHTVFPIIPYMNVPRNVLGELYGVRAVSGNSNASENIMNIDGVDHVVFQNAWNTDPTRYWALELS